MSSRRIELTYLRKPAVNLSTGEKREVWIPSVPVSISSSSKTTPYMFNALIDSGADSSLFPADHGRVIGINIESVPPRKIGGIGGIIIGYRHDIVLHVAGKDFVTYVDFSDKCEVPLLGREGFFDLFKRVDFNEQKHKIVLNL